MKYMLDTNEKDLIMVTENIGEFERITGITIQNWINRNK